MRNIKESLVQNKARIDHNHNDLYYTVEEVNQLLDEQEHTASDITDFNEAVDDRVNELLSFGEGLSKDYDDEAGTYVINFTGGSGGVSDHGALTGLADDDHTQYHTDARGDARYYQKSEVDTALAGKSDTTHTHTEYEPANANIQTHIATTGNPHGTTAADVGAYTSGQVDSLLANKSNTDHNHNGVYLGVNETAVNSDKVDGYHASIADTAETVVVRDAAGKANVTALQLSGGVGTQGTFSWNTDEQTVDLIQNGTTLQLGQEIQYNVRNNTASIITNGTVVMATGTLGASSRITVAPMDGSVQSNAKYCLGIATEDIAPGGDGKVTHFGKVRQLDTSAFVDGQVLWVSTTTAGALTATKPTTGMAMSIAFVIHAASNGTLFVRVNGIDENLFSTGGGGSSTYDDPFFADVSLLLNCNGTNGSATFTDSSIYANAVTPSGAVLSTSVFKYGTASGSFDGINDNLLITSPNLALISITNYTVETWIRLNAYPASWNGVFFNGNTGSNEHRTQLEISSTGKLSLYLQATTGSGSTFTGVTTIPLNTFVHIAVVRAGTSYSVYLNGTLDVSGSYTSAITANNNFYIGLSRTGGVLYSLNGYIDDFRVTRAIRYTGDFIPPASEMPSSSTSYTNYLPAGGTAGQMLAKVDATDYNVEWVDPASGGGANVYVSDTVPAVPADYPLWFDSVSGRLKVYYSDGDSSQYVDSMPFGLKGDTGEQGIPGTNGTNGADGADGLSAYQVAVNNGFVGTEAQWLASLQGADGATGATGATGADGADGVGVPAGGTTGQLLAKIDGTDYNTQWVNPPSGGGGGSLPAGGTVNQVLTKLSSTDGDATWKTPKDYFDLIYNKNIQMIGPSIPSTITSTSSLAMYNGTGTFAVSGTGARAYQSLGNAGATNITRAPTIYLETGTTTTGYSSVRSASNLFSPASTNMGFRVKFGFGTVVYLSGTIVVLGISSNPVSSTLDVANYTSGITIGYRTTGTWQIYIKKSNGTIETIDTLIQPSVNEYLSMEIDYRPGMIYPLITLKDELTQTVIIDKYQSTVSIDDNTGSHYFLSYIRATTGIAAKTLGVRYMYLETYDV